MAGAVFSETCSYHFTSIRGWVQLILGYSHVRRYRFFLFCRFRWLLSYRLLSFRLARNRNVYIGLPLFTIRVGYKVRWQMGWLPRWNFRWVRLMFSGAKLLNSWDLLSKGRLVQCLYPLYSRAGLIRQLWRRYKRCRRRSKNLVIRGIGRRLRITDVRRRQLRYLKVVRGEARYLLGLYYRSYRLARYMHHLGRFQSGLFGGLSWSGVRLPYLLCLLKFSGHLWESRELIQGGAIRINGRTCTDLNYFVQTGDYIQFVVGKELMFYQHCVRRLYRRRRELQVSRRRRRRRTAGYRFYILRRLPRRTKWIFRTMHDVGDLGKYFEVDYTTMGFIMLYKPYLLNHFRGFFLRVLHWHFWRIYSWKLH